MSIYPTDAITKFDFSKQLEWLETNGLGGYACSSVSGANTRKYHGLLIASVTPPVNRMVVVSKLEETIISNNNRFSLSANQYPGAVHPKGYEFLKSFERNMFPVFHYSAGGVEIKKTIAAVHGENTTLVLYEVTKAPNEFTMEFLPLYSCRDFHSLSHKNDSIGQNYLFDNGTFRTMNYQGCPEFFITIPGAEFIEHKTWYYNVEYAVEQYRGLEYAEDLYTHGTFNKKLKSGDRFGVIISTDDPSGRDPFKIFAKEQKRRTQLIKDHESSNTLRRLLLAADQFIVKRGNLNTVVAGYPWFADWGRDTMISLTGLCLVTKRYKEARNILKKFSECLSEGMLPNRFTDHGEPPEYNTVDATLWFFIAVYKYYTYTKDIDFLTSLMPKLHEIILWHNKGTRFGIHVDSTDELLSAGDDGVQLTWMDAKVGNWVVTPRRGKPVEINALWYNAVKIMAIFQKDTGDEKSSVLSEQRAQRIASSFNDTFWNEKIECLYDFVNATYKNDDVRPNQLYAIGLPFTLLSNDKAQKVLSIVKGHLLTPRGLRSLSPGHKDYHPFYGGDVHSRDSAYHQGTVWSFLTGIYIDSIFTVHGANAKIEASEIITKMTTHLDEACIGSISEIFDGNAPHAPRGCIAQAWGVAEMLRVIFEYKLM